LAQERCPDLITADDRLGDGSGIGAVRHICRDQTIPVVFITADPQHIAQTVPHAVILEKPFTHAGLVRAINRAVQTVFVASPRDGTLEPSALSQ